MPIFLSCWIRKLRDVIEAGPSDIMHGWNVRQTSDFVTKGSLFSGRRGGCISQTDMDELKPPARWEHFPHAADMGIRGMGITKSQAFEQAALALTAIVTDPQRVSDHFKIRFSCDAPDDELLLVDWLNAIIYEMACGHNIFSRFDVSIQDHHLEASAIGEPVNRIKHEPAVEIKGATYTELSVRHIEGKGWVAQCVVDV